jgi:hypothetical protein
MTKFYVQYKLGVDLLNASRLNTLQKCKQLLLFNSELNEYRTLMYFNPELKMCDMSIPCLAANYN